MGGRPGVQAKWEGPCRVLSCLALVSCRVRVFPVFGTTDSGIVTAFGLVGVAWGWAGQGSLAGPECSPKDCDTWQGRGLARLLKPNNKPCPKPKPSSGLFEDGIGTRGEESAAWSRYNLVTIGVDECVCCVLHAVQKKRNMPRTVQESEMRGRGHGEAVIDWHPTTGESSWAAQSDICQEALKTAGAVESVGHAPLCTCTPCCSALAGGTGAGSPIWQGAGMEAARW